jgi:ATP-dependent RNA helicase SUPV3L1/SUV3
MPALLADPARGFLAGFAGLGAPDWRPSATALSPLPQPIPPATVLAAHGLRAITGLAVPVETLEALDAALRAAPRIAGGSALSEEAVAALGWSPAEAARLLRALGFATARKPVQGEPVIWRRRQPRKAAPAPQPYAKATPFAALAALTPKPAAPARERRRPRKPRRPRRQAS